MQASWACVCFGSSVHAFVHVCVCMCVAAEKVVKEEDLEAREKRQSLTPSSYSLVNPSQVLSLTLCCSFIQVC